MGLDSYKLKGAAREEFLKRSQEIAKEELDQAELFELYTDYIYQQKNGFLSLINYINQKIHELIIQGKISEYVKIKARIKSIKSASINHKKERDAFKKRISIKLEDSDIDSSDSIEGKILDDVFGMEIVCATEEEIEIIKEEIENFISKRKPTKKHDKPNGYKAQHDSYYLKEEIYSENDTVISPNETPLIECQYKTIEVVAKSQFGGEASHVTYKGEDPELLQEQYNNGKLKIGINLPLMYESSIDEHGKPIMRRLTLAETIRREYPFIDMSKTEKAKE